MPMTEASARIGVDLGGTKIEAVALDADGRELVRRRIPTPAGGYSKTVAAVVELVRAVEAELSAAGAMAASVGMGIPGAISPATGLIKNANSTCLIGHKLDLDLAAALGRPVRIMNDANCFAVSEATDGAGAGAAVVFGAILGTGVGGGLVVHGRVLTGANAIAGEWGHNPLPWPEDDERPGPSCYCGRLGCIEAFLGGGALARQYLDLGRRELDPPAIEAAAAFGDEIAETVLRRYEARLARSLATVINLLDPDVIVLGGGLSNLRRLYANVPSLWRRWVFSDRVDTVLKPPLHGDSSGARGAAWLWPAV